jgi:hypothetical protein
MSQDAGQQGDRRPIVPILIGALVVAIVAIVVILVAGGSDDDNGGGSSGGGDGAEEVFAPQIVTDEDIDAFDEGTPERALLEWWQAFQFHDALTVRAMTSTATRKAIGPHALADVVRRTGLPGISILGVSVNGDTALVQAGILNFQPPEPGAPPPREPTGSQPATFKLVKERGAWVFDQPDFVVPKVENLEK